MEYGELGGGKVEVEGAEVTEVTYDNYGDGGGLVDFQIDGDAFRNMKTVNITYEVWDSLGNVTTGTVSRKISVWDIYEALGGPNYYSLAYTSVDRSFSIGYSHEYGTVTKTSDGKYNVFTKVGTLNSAECSKGDYIRDLNTGKLYYCSGYSGTGSNLKFLVNREYNPEPERCNYENQKGVRYDLVENRFPVNGRSGANWYILRSE